MADTEWFAVQRLRDGVYLVGGFAAVLNGSASFTEGRDCFGTPVKQASFNDFSIVVARDFATLA